MYSLGPFKENVALREKAAEIGFHGGELLHDGVGWVPVRRGVRSDAATFVFRRCR